MAKEPQTLEELEKKKKTRVISALIMILGIGVFGSLAFSIYDMIRIAKQMSKKESTKPRIISKKEVEKGWKDITEERLSDLEDNQRKVRDILQKLQKNQEELFKKFQEIEIKLGEINSKTRSSTVQPSHIHKAQNKKLPKESLKELAPPPKTYINSHKTFEEKLQQKAPEEKKEPELIKFTPIETSQVQEQENEQKKLKLKIPVGFVRGITLTGLDAPTFQWGMQNPHPILISLEDREILANNRKLNLKACFILGSGFGEVSSERAYIRLVKISCIGKDNGLYEGKVKGWLIDDDGKVGLKGRLVTKQGAYLSKALIAGFLSGISKILQAGATTVSVSPLGTTSTISPSKATKIGIFAGTGNAMDRLARFYEKMAEQIFPVIEITPGRRVVVLLEGGDEISKGNEITLDPIGILGGLK